MFWYSWVAELGIGVSKVWRKHKIIKYEYQFAWLVLERKWNQEWRKCDIEGPDWKDKSVQSEYQAEYSEIDQRNEQKYVEPIQLARFVGRLCGFQQLCEQCLV